MEQLNVSFSLCGQQQMCDFDDLSQLTAVLSETDCMSFLT